MRRRPELPLLLAALLCGELLAISGAAAAGSAPAGSGHPAVAQHEAAALPLAGRVTDAARLLGPSQVARLEDKLAAFERKTRHQLVVVTVRSLDGRDIADFTRDLGNAWGIGRKGYDDGVILLVAPNERKVRIAVGYGLETTLTKSACSRIIEADILPSFRQGDFPGGIEAGIDQLIARLP